MSELKKASRWRRAVALFIDEMTIMCLVLAIILTFTGLFEENPIVMGLSILIGVILGLYLLSTKDCRSGVSIGRWIMGIGVRDSENHQIVPDRERLINRTFSLMNWPAEVVRLLFSKERRRGGDITYKTDVIQINEKRNAFIALIFSFIIFVSMIGSISLLSNILIKASEAYHTATNFVRENADIQRTIGRVKGFGFFQDYSMQTSNGYGTATFDLEVIGQSGSRNTEISLSKEPGHNWKVEKYEFKQ